ncbi:hypothetical protein SCE1572_20130 [Sorangium cellulosum So0157-2]|uniref:Uncharacterized protein n=1 Tax=Sorangium cellulosum So0157-2 TaxID=1254432 RepID=S4XVT3_SORCE|nr:hypothetical protein SCE1572_20130 [Sorangium cellulosum So0157-2]
MSLIRPSTTGSPGAPRSSRIAAMKPRSVSP